MGCTPSFGRMSHRRIPGLHWRCAQSWLRSHLQWRKEFGCDIVHSQLAHYSSRPNLQLESHCQKLWPLQPWGDYWDLEWSEAVVAAKKSLHCNLWQFKLDDNHVGLVRVWWWIPHSSPNNLRWQCSSWSNATSSLELALTHQFISGSNS